MISPRLRRPALTFLSATLCLSACMPAPPDAAPRRQATSTEDRPKGISYDLPERGFRDDPGAECVPLECDEFCGRLDNGCGEAVDCGGCADPVSMQIAATSPTVLVGESMVIAVQAIDANGTFIADPDVAWSVDDDTVVEVDATGALRGLKRGKTKIVATLAGLEAEVAIEVEDQFQAVTSGSKHNCALTRSGRAYCWGDGALGSPGGPALGLRAVSTPNRYAEIAAGVAHSCAIRADRTGVDCWGANDANQLGGAAVGASVQPIEVPIPADPPYERIVSGSAQTCVLADGTPYCWGGTGPATPTRGYEGLASLTLGQNFGCGVQGDTDITCWGPSTDEIVQGEPMTMLRIPRESDGLVQVQALVSGDAHTCALGDDDLLYCWGANEAGQVDPDEDEPRLDEPTVASDDRYARAAAGPRQTCAVRKSDSERVDCWGDFAIGVEHDEEVDVLSVGGAHACAILRDDSLSCWGSNDAGQLGDGSTVDSDEPVRSGPSHR